MFFTKGFIKFHKISSDHTVTLLTCLFLVCYTVALYCSVDDFDFIIYDDPLYTTNNPYVKQGLNIETIVWAVTESTQYSNYWVPLTWLSFLVDCEIYGMNPGGFHTTNVIFHAVATMLLFLAFYRMTGKRWRSGFVAVLFAIHPLHVESVAWVSERKDVLSALFWMLSMLSYTFYAKDMQKRRYVLVMASIVMGLLAKPMVVTLPFVLLLCDYWPLNRTGILEYKTTFPIRSFGQLVWEKMPLLFTIVCFSVLTFITQAREGAIESTIPIFVRIENVLVVYITQIGKMFWPFRLGLLYPHPGQLPPWQPIGAFFLLLLISWLCFQQRKRYPYLIFGWLWYLGTFLPVSGLIVIGPHVTADRYTYIPLIGLFVIIAWGASDFIAKVRHKNLILTVVGTTGLIFFTIITLNQIKHWRNNFTIYEQTLAVTKNNWIIHLNLGTALLNVGKQQEALRHFQAAQRIRPDKPQLYLSIGTVLVSLGKMREAASYFRQAIDVNPAFAEAYLQLGIVLDKLGESMQALQYLKNAIRLEPHNDEVHHALGVVLDGQGKTEEGIRHFKSAITINPQFAKAYVNIGVVLANQGKIDKAIRFFKKTLRHDPKFADAHYYWGLVLMLNGDKDQAAKHFKRALAIKPGHALAKQGIKRLEIGGNH